MLFPRFRSKERDLRSDIERLSTIHQVVLRAIADARSEATGLAARVEDARSRAAFLYGDVIDGVEEPDPKHSELIQEAERFLVRGERRRDELDAHTDFLRGLDKQLADGIAALKIEQRED